MNWLTVVRRLQAIAQTGLAYSRDPYDVDRFHALQEVTAKIAASAGDHEANEAAAILSLETGYATPEVGVRGVVFDAGNILLVRERTDVCYDPVDITVAVGDGPYRFHMPADEAPAGMAMPPETETVGGHLDDLDGDGLDNGGLQDWQRQEACLGREVYGRASSLTQQRAFPLQEGRRRVTEWLDVSPPAATA